MIRTRSLLFVTLLLLIMPFAVHAQGAYTAASCNQSDVNAVINGPTHKAVNGDTIQIPAGSCTWTKGITVTGVGIDITGTGTPNTGGGTVGAGTPNTTLIDNANTAFFNFTGLTIGQTAKVELLTMSAAGAGSNTIAGAIFFYGTCTASGCANIRVDNINFSAGTWGTPTSGGFIVIDNVFGVVDHNTANESTAATAPLVQVNYDAWQGVGANGDNSFASADTFGTAQAMYLENNSISGIQGTQNDVSSGGVGGARYVCRFNTVTNMSGAGFCSGHGTAWGGRPRGQRQVEVYYNTVSKTPGFGGDAGNGLNSGVGYYFSNSYSTSPGFGFNKFVALEIPRYDPRAPVWGHCDGSQPWDQTPWSTTTQCLDQPGRGVGLLLAGPATATVLASAPSTPCTTVGQCWPNPALDPVYEAGEVMTVGALGTAPVSVAGDGSQLRILPNRDYYAEVSQSAQTSATSPFNGTVGTGYGTLANRPTTCTTGVGYWATDQGTWNTFDSRKGQLFICTSTNTWTLHFAPYTYPHPLTTGGTSAGGNPNPPTNLTSSVQ